MVVQIFRYREDIIVHLAHDVKELPDSGMTKLSIEQDNKTSWLFVLAEFYAQWATLTKKINVKDVLVEHKISSSEIDTTTVLAYKTWRVLDNCYSLGEIVSFVRHDYTQVEIAHAVNEWVSASKIETRLRNISDKVIQQHAIAFTSQMLQEAVAKVHGDLEKVYALIELNWSTSKTDNSPEERQAQMAKFGYEQLEIERVTKASKSLCQLTNLLQDIHLLTQILSSENKMIGVYGDVCSIRICAGFFQYLGRRGVARVL